MDRGSGAERAAIGGAVGRRSGLRDLFLRAARSGFLLSLCLVLATLSGCIHLARPSNVRPGAALTVLAGATREGHEAPANDPVYKDIPATSATDLQVDLEYGWKLSADRGIRLGLAVPLTMHEATPLGALLGTSADVYYQFAGAPLEAGFGGFLGLTSGAYLQAGRPVGTAGGGIIRLDGGLALLGVLLATHAAFRPFGALAWERDRWRLALWGDLDWYPRPLRRCDDDCDPEDYLKTRGTVGAAVSRYFR